MNAYWKSACKCIASVTFHCGRLQARRRQTSKLVSVAFKSTTTVPIKRRRMFGYQLRTDSTVLAPVTEGSHGTTRRRRYVRQLSAVTMWVMNTDADLTTSYSQRPPRLTCGGFGVEHRLLVQPISSSTQSLWVEKYVYQPFLDP